MSDPYDNDDIIFTDLRGDPDDIEETVTVDLDAGKDVRRTPRIDSGRDDDDSTADDLDIVIRRGGSDDDGQQQGRDAGRSKTDFDKRLDRERRAKRREKTRADQLAEENARLKRENESLGKKQQEETTAELDRQITGLEKDLKTAIEAGNTDEQIRLNSQITDLKAEKVAVRYGATETDSDPGDAGDPPPDRKTQKNEHLDDWLSGHSDWFGKRGFERQTRMANRIDQEVFDDGFDPGTEEYFEELNARLREKAPEVFDSGDADGRDSDPPPRRNQAPVGGVEDGSAGSDQQRLSSNQVVLNDDDFENMRRFGMDPNDPATLREYALNKRQRMLEENR